jgi:hypothetical protein
VLEFNEKNARKIYSDDRFSWIADQIVKAAGDRKRFFQVASKS